MNSETSNDRSGRDEERVAKDMCARLLELPPSTLRRVCELLIWRDRFLKATWGDYGLFRYTDFFEYGLDVLEVKPVDEMRYLPTRFHQLKAAETRSEQALMAEQDTHQKFKEKRSRGPGETSIKIFLRTYRLRRLDGKKWDQVLIIINREFPGNGKPRYSDKAALRKGFRRIEKSPRGRRLIREHFETQ